MFTPMQELLPATFGSSVVLGALVAGASVFFVAGASVFFVVVGSSLALQASALPWYFTLFVKSDPSLVSVASLSLLHVREQNCKLKARMSFVLIQV